MEPHSNHNQERQKYCVLLQIAQGRKVHHPSTGLNLLMTGVDLLDGGTGPHVISQRSEAGRSKLGAKSGRDKYDMWYDWVVKTLLSSCMSVGRSFVERPDMSCLVITTIRLYCRRHDY